MNSEWLRATYIKQLSQIKEAWQRFWPLNPINQTIKSLRQERSSDQSPTKMFYPSRKHFYGRHVSETTPWWGIWRWLGGHVTQGYTLVINLPPLEGCGGLLTWCLGKSEAPDGLKILPTDFTAPMLTSSSKRVKTNNYVNPLGTALQSVAMVMA